jgi:hypothetical protein
MGYGAFMKVVNNRSDVVQTFVTDVNCMYDGGEDGSDLSLFNNAKIDAGSSVPDAQQGQYIEAKNSGGCFFESSTFTLKVEDGTNHVVIGQVVFEDSSENWNFTSSNPDVIDVYVNNSGDQAVIQVTVEST